MRSFLPFAALLGVALVLGCQDVGTGVEGPDGLLPQFARGGEKGNSGGGGGGVVGFLTLTGGMATAMNQNLPVILSASYAAQNNAFDQDITMNFTTQDGTSYPDVYDPVSFLDHCEIIRGTNGVHHALTIESGHANRLLAELRATVESGKFYMDIDPTGDFFIDIQYDHNRDRRRCIYFPRLG